MTATADDGLRARRARATSAELREAFVRLVAERGLEAVSLADVAADAGVSERTLYRYYPSRDALVRATFEEEVAAFDRRHAETDPFDLARPGSVARTYALFEEHADLMQVGRALRAAGQDMATSASRTARVREALAGHVHPDALEQLVGLVRSIGGIDAWFRMREPDIDLTNDEAGDAVQWALQVVLEAAMRADGALAPIPGRPDPNPTRGFNDDGHDGD